MATTKLILNEKIKGLGAEADVVTVKAGYARNFLIPSGKALEATSANLLYIDSLKAARVRREAEELTEAQSLAGKIAKLKPSFTLEVGENGKAFGSVTTIDIHNFLTEKGYELDRTAIQLKKPLKSTGKSDIEIKLHNDVTTSLTVKVEANTPAAEAAE
nr:large ribosomal subunit protein bL9-like [Nerophis lumbriciformis]